MKLEKLTRRHFMASGAMIAGGATFSMPNRLLAAPSSDVVVGTWGGDYERLLRELVAPIAAEKGVNFAPDVGSAPARKTKLLAQVQRKTNSMDIVCLSNEDMAQVAKQNILADINEDIVPNVANVYPELKVPYAIPHLYSGMVIVYNPEVVERPTSYKDLWKEEYSDALGFSDLLYIYNIAAAAQAHGGTKSDFDPARKALLDLKGRSRVYPSNEAVANALYSKEIGATIMWKARAYQWRKNGVPVEFVVPTEGALPMVFEAGVTGNANNPEGATIFLNAMLDPAAQRGFAMAMGYLPSIRNAGLPEGLEEELGFDDAERGNFFYPDSDYIRRTSSEWLNWWKQEFLG